MQKQRCRAIARVKDNEIGEHGEELQKCNQLRTMETGKWRGKACGKISKGIEENRAVNGRNKKMPELGIVVSNTPILLLHSKHL